MKPSETTENPSEIKQNQAILADSWCNIVSKQTFWKETIQNNLGLVETLQKILVSQE